MHDIPMFYEMVDTNFHRHPYTLIFFHAPSRISSKCINLWKLSSNVAPTPYHSYTTPQATCTHQLLKPNLQRHPYTVIYFHPQCRMDQRCANTTFFT